MKLEIATINGLYFSGEVTTVTLPGSDGSFTILENHAPLISDLSKGKLRYTTNDIENEIETLSGFVEVNNNTITVCIDVESEK